MSATKPPPSSTPTNRAGALTAKPMDFTGSLRRFAGTMRPERGQVFFLLLCGALSVGLTVTGPRVLGAATDVIFEGMLGRTLGATLPHGLTGPEAAEALRDAGDASQADMIANMPGLVVGEGLDTGRLGLILLLATAVYLAAFLFGWLQARIMAVVVQRVMRRLRGDVEHKLHRVPLSYLDSRRKGDILSRVTNDIDNVAQTTTQTFSQIITAVLTALGVLAMMFSVSWSLALVALVTLPISVAATIWIARRAQPHFSEQWAATGRLNAHVEEMFTGHALVKVYGRQAEAAERFAEENEALHAATAKSQFISGTIHPVMSLLGNLNYVVIAVVGGLQVAAGSLSIGGVQAFLQYSRQFSQPLSQLASMMNLLQSGVASVERVFEVLDAPEEEADPSPARELEEVSGRVTFESVSFSYSPDTPLIEELDLAAEPGSTVAIVGPTGAGKTTLVNLLMRFYEVTGGRVALDGVDIRELTRAGLRSRTGMVLQDTWLFTGTIEENLRYGVPEGREVSREEFLAATRATHVDQFVRTLPEGYDTVIDEDSTALSTGERQLLTIARAFLADPQILILDEATSSVDTRTEVLIQQAMNELRSGRTSFVIAHRLSTIRDSDVIVVMEQGRIVEQGDHETLLAADGPYARLHASQFTAPMERQPEEGTGAETAVVPDL